MQNIKRQTIFTLESLEFIHMGSKYISSGPFGQTFCDMDRKIMGLFNFPQCKMFFPIQ